MVEILLERYQRGEYKIIKTARVGLVIRGEEFSTKDTTASKIFDKSLGRFHRD